MSEVIPWPFPLPERFLDALGYARALAAFESPAMRARVAELLRQQGVDSHLAPPTGPRRLVMLYWEPAGDELGWTDGRSSGAGQLNHWLYLDLVHRPQVHAWLVEHAVDPGSSEASGTHALVRAQRLEGPPMA
jgi:hypothetical protein